MPITFQTNITFSYESWISKEKIYSQNTKLKFLSALKFINITTFYRL